MARKPFKSAAPRGACLLLDLSRHCIETELKRLYNRAVTDYLRSVQDKAAVEEVIELTRQALACLDFGRLRSRHVPLAGRTASRVELVREHGRPVIRIDGRSLPADDETHPATT